MVVQAQTNSAAETSRGIKSDILNKPTYEEPRFQEEKELPLDTEKVLPKPEQFSGDKKIEARQTIYVNKILVEGSSVLSEEELNTFTKPYEKRDITISELEKLRNELSIYYYQ